jgi:hypothetical protein
MAYLKTYNAKEGQKTAQIDVKCICKKIKNKNAKIEATLS